jgi:hypothetical protein
MIMAALAAAALCAVAVEAKKVRARSTLLSRRLHPRDAAAAVAAAPRSCASW